jgi:hypothetical protein
MSFVFDVFKSEMRFVFGLCFVFLFVCVVCY